MGSKSVKNSHFGPKNLQLSPNLVKTCNLISKFGLFWPKKGIFDPSLKKNCTPTLHENHIRSLENASINLKIGMHVPWDI